MSDQGFGANGTAFEYTVERKGKTRKTRRIFLILLYVAWIITFFTVGTVATLLFPLLCFIPFSTWILVWLTWRFTREEIHFTLLSGGMTVERRYDGKNKKVLAETRIKNIEVLEPYSAELISRYKKANVVYATEADEYAGAYIMAWGNFAVVAAIDDKMMKIIKYYR
jgi:hypothetical protein